MNARSPLLWHQGLFLTPQHFQLMDWHRHASAEAVTGYAQRHFWGVGALELREEALAARTVEPTRVEALFPGGFLVSAPGNALLEPRPLTEQALASDKPVTVYLGLRRFNPEGANVTMQQELRLVGQPATIFVAKSDPDTVPDLHTTGPASPVKTMRYALGFYFDHELPGLGGYQLLPVARVLREGDRLRYDQDFIPPCLTLASVPALESLLRTVADLVASRARALEDYKMRGELTSKEFDPGYMVFLMALMTLNRYAPLLAHHVEAGTVHPWKTYGVLRQFLGELSTFADDFGALGDRFDGEKLVPAYDHENLTACFSACRQLIERMIEGIGTSIELLAALVKKDSYHSVELPERVLTPGNRFWLIIRSETAGDAVVREVLSTVKLCASPLMATLLMKAVPGVGLSHSPNPPAGLPKRSGTHYFQLDTTGPLWGEVVRNRSLSMYWDSPPQDMTAHLAVLRGK